MERLTPVMAKGSEPWEGGTAKSVTFIVTEGCQLRCRYCYLVGKNDGARMEFDVAGRTVDYLLEHRDLFRERSVIWDFIGGEPFLEIELIDRICDYIKRAMFERDHPWFNNYRFSFSTNGLLYLDERVQAFIKKNITHLSIGITIDGTRKKHDLNRVYPNGQGSYNDVVKAIPFWLSQFPNGATKVTVSHNDLPYIKESVLHLFSLGISTVNINVVFENVWEEGDDDVLEEQLRALADIMVEKRLYETHHCSFFSEMIGKPIGQHEERNWCGSGKMLAVDAKGNFYPCNRFVGFSLTRKEPRVVGNCFDGIDENKLRPFLALSRTAQSPQECIECDVASGCAWCQGHNYDVADSGTIYQRATYICKMHKARVRANRYYFRLLRETIRKERAAALVRR